MTNLAIPTRALGLAMACLSSVAASAQTTPSAPAPAVGPAASAPAAGAIMPGMAVVDPAGAAVGTVSSVNGDQLVIKTDKHEVQLPATSFTADKGKLLFALTQAQLNTQVEQALAEANAKLVVGTNVYGAGGTQAGTITQIDDKFLTMKLTSGKLVRLPRTAIAPSANGAVLGMSAAELQKLAEQAK